MKKRLIQLLGIVLLLVCPVLSQAQINYQYWIDNNIGAAVSGTTTDGTAVALSIDVAGLSPGVHFYNIRARENQKWGTIYRYLFCIPKDANAATSQLGGYEYWLDNNYEQRTTVVGTSGDHTLTPSIDASMLEPGVHFYNIRVKDENGQWSPVYRYLFAIPREQQEVGSRLITGYRYGFGDELTTVNFATPVSEYTLNESFDVPEVPQPKTIDDDCHFSFSDDEATLLRNITMEFALTFTDESKAMSSPIGTSFTLADTRTSDIQTLEVAGSLPIEAHAQGGYTVVKFDIPAADNYTLTTTAASSLRLFSSIGATLTTVGSDDLTTGYAQDYEADTYYAVVFGNAEEVTLSLAGDGEPCGYAILDSETGTLTFKYGIMPNGDNVWETENTAFNDNNRAPWACLKLKLVVFEESYAEARPTSTAGWFHDAVWLTEITGLQYLNTSNVTDMSHMFYYCKSLTSLDVSHFDTSKVTDMFHMFSTCKSLTSLDVSHFDTSNVTNMGCMFFGCNSLTSLDVSHFDTSNVTRMGMMFNSCSGLTSLDVSHFDTSNVTLMGWMFSGCSSLTSLDVSHFDTGKVTDMELMFYGCSSLTSLDVSHFETGNVKNMYDMFYGCSGLTSLDVSHFDTGNVTDMNGMFYGCSNLTSLDVSHFDTGNVTDMNGMFYGCSNLTSLDVSHFDTGNVTSMYGMFSGCSNLTSLDVSHFDTRNVIEFGIKTASYDGFGMFQGCEKLTSLDLSSFNTAKAEYMGFMFQGCSNLKTIYVGEGWTTENVTKSDQMFANCFALVGCAGTVYNSNYTDVTYAHVDEGPSNPGYLTIEGYVPPVKVGYAILDTETGTLTFKYGVMPSGENVWETENTKFKNNKFPWICDDLKLVVFDASYAEARPISTAGWFYNTSNPTETPKLTEIIGLEYLNTSNVADMSMMFYGCRSISSLDVSHFDTSNVIDMRGMFDGCNSLTSLDLSHFNTSNVIDMSTMFVGCTSLSCLDLSHFDTSNVTKMASMFWGCRALTNLDISDFDTSNVTDISGMFFNCRSLTSLNLNHFNTGNVTDMTNMFMMFDGSSLTSLDISHFDTSNVTSMAGMFQGCNSLTSLDVSHFDTSNVTNMAGMFQSCNSLTSLDVSHFDTSNVTNMAGMFIGCTSLASLDISHFNTENVTDMAGMFADCSSLTSLDVSHFDTRKVVSLGGPKIADKTYAWGGMFQGCGKLTSLDLSSFNTAKVESMSIMFVNCEKLETIYVGEGWTTENVSNSDNMFAGCFALVGGKGTKYNSSYLDKTYARIDGGTSAPGYFTYKSPEHEETDYAIFDSETGTLTFKYGVKPEGENVYPTIYDMAEYKQIYGAGFISPWHPIYKELKTVIFDESYSIVRPKSLYSWFIGALHLNEINGLEYLNTSEVENMSNLFGDCSSLTELDLSHFNTGNVTDMSGMFSECSSLKTIYVGDQWSTASITNGKNMFYGCTSLVGGSGTIYDNGHTDHTYAHIDGGTENPGYFSKRASMGFDINNDSKLDVKDIVDLIDFIAGKSPKDVTKDSADVNGDGKVDIADVIMVASATLSK